MLGSINLRLALLVCLILAFPLCLLSQPLRGDVNCDGEVNIIDVDELINYLLRDTWSDGQSGELIDMRGDADLNGEVTIGDVNELINYLLRDSWTDEYEVSTRVFDVNGVKFTMLRVEGGSFVMGATEEQGDDAWEWEKPSHVVTVSSYTLGQTEVTQALWQAVMGYNPSFFVSDPQLPVEKVSWDDCQVFIARLNTITGQRFRLPTEAEWEYAARGGNMSRGWKYAGSNEIDDVAWYQDNAAGGTHVVATLQCNELGLFDMSGNVWEWCQDVYGPYPTSPQVNPTGPAAGTYRVYRGGGWNSSPRSCRVSYRFDRSPSATYNNQGLRLAM